MKKLSIITVSLVLSVSVQAQVAIGKQSVTNTSVSLEFSNENRGLILPYNINKTGITEPGTLIYDTTDQKVKYLKDSGDWADLSENDGTTGTDGTKLTTAELDAVLAIQGTDKTEKTTAKTVIGADGAANTTDGILVLSDNDKAMILPSVAKPYENIINPAPGMMVYDTEAKQLAVYNGKSWSFWKP